MYRALPRLCPDSAPSPTPKSTSSHGGKCPVLEGPALCVGGLESALLLPNNSIRGAGGAVRTAQESAPVSNGAPTGLVKGNICLRQPCPPGEPPAWVSRVTTGAAVLVLGENSEMSAQSRSV